MKSTRPLRRPRRTGPAGRHGSPTAAAAAFAVLTALVAVLALALPSLASADSSAQLTVVGTSDVSDSGLMPNLVQPGFSAAYPQFTFKYIGTASGTAITDAETGVNAPSVLIVHAASLENQFVAGGYSYEPYGRAIWTNDFVLAGPTADPAGVGANAAHNVAQAFADIATAGAAGKATFVSRGGTPGTTVSEHGIWGLVYTDNLTPAGVDLCAVPNTAADPLGGGYTPIAPAAGVTNGEACPGGVLPGTAGGGALPAWYEATGDTQGPNVVAANACTGQATDDCYVYTDRGTYDYLLSGGTASGGANQIPNLAILTRDNSASAPGGANELENYFHAYIINPAKSPTPVNLTAAQDFIDYITSPALQSKLSGYLANTGDPGGAPFHADASPAITAAGIPGTIAGGVPVTVTGTVTNQEPNYAVPANQTVTVDEVVGGVPIPVASGTTNSTGAYSVAFTPPSTGTYQVSTGLISLIENASLTPPFGDLLSPGASAATAVTVNGSAIISRTTTAAREVSLAGSILPVTPDTTGTATLLARNRSSTGAFKTVGHETLAKGLGTYAVNGTLTGGAYTVKVEYSDGTAFTAATTGTRNVIVPNKEVDLKFNKVHLSGGRLVLQGKLAQGPVSNGAQVRLLVASVGSLPKSTKKHAVGPQKTKKPHFEVKRVATAHLKRGRETFTIRHTLKRGYRYVIQLQYVHKGQKTTYSPYRHLTVR